jgi:hypothetical protein
MHIELSPENESRLRKLADSEGISPEQIATELIRDHLDMIAITDRAREMARRGDTVPPDFLASFKRRRKR